MEQQKRYGVHLQDNNGKSVMKSIFAVSEEQARKLVEQLMGKEYIILDIFLM